MIDHPGTGVVKTQCPICKGTKEVLVSPSDFEAWKGGKLIQDAFPYLSRDDRERLISGFCPKCWDIMFKTDGEEE